MCPIMKLKKIMQSIGMALFVAMTANWSQAELLMYEGFPTSETGYNMAATDIAKIIRDVPVITDSRVIGFKPEKWSFGTGIIYVYGTGLSLPTGFPNESFVGEGKIGRTDTKVGGDMRGLWKGLSVDLSKQTGKLHFRCLLSGSAASLSQLGKSTATSPLLAPHYMGAGWVKSSNTSSVNYQILNASTTSHELAFVIRKDTDGVLKLSLVLKGTGDSALRCVDLLNGVVGDVTYICYAEVAIGAGTDGKEVVRAYAAPVTDSWDSDLTGLVDAGEVDLINKAGYPDRLAVAGGQEAGYFVDELAISTEARDVVKCNSLLPLIDQCTVEKTAEGQQVARVTILDNAGTVQIQAQSGEDIYTLPETVAVNAGETAVIPLDRTIIPADKTCQLTAIVSNAAGASRKTFGLVYTGKVLLETIQDAKEEGVVPAIIRVMRADAAPYPLVVGLELSSDEGAVENVDWLPAEDHVTIPAGETAVEFKVSPKLNLDSTVSPKVQVRLTDVPEIFDTSSLAVFTLLNFSFPSDYNIWVAREDSDGLASTVENWTLGVPRNDDEASRHIVLNGLYSQQPLVWDLPTVNTVESWSQNENYTSVVTLPMKYESATGDLMDSFTVLGDMEVLGGKIAQKQHSKTDKVGLYRLKLNVNGNLTVGASGRIDVSNCGLYSSYPSMSKVGHGGEVGSLDKAKFTFLRYVPNGQFPAHGSIITPTDVSFGSNSGTDSEAKRSFGGGAIDLTVKGVLTNEGVISANGGKQYSAAGSGGSLLIHAKSLAGAGTYSADATKADKSDGCGAMGAGGRIAIYVSEGDIPLDQCSVTSYREGWGAMGGYGTIYLSTPKTKKIVVKGVWTYASRIGSWNWGVTPIPAKDDPSNWTKDFKDTEFEAVQGVNVILTRPLRMKSLNVEFNEPASNKRQGAMIDLAGQTIVVQKVLIDGEDQKLKPGTVLTAEQAAERGWTWLVDSSQKSLDFTEVYNGVERNVQDLTAYDYPEGTPPGSIRIVGAGFLVIVR